MHEVALKWDDTESKYFNVMHYELTDTTFAGLQAFADEIGAACASDLADILTDSISLIGVNIREDVEGAVGIDFGFTTGPVDGTNANSDYAAVLALQVNKLCQNGSRPSRGWNFIPGVSAQELSGSGRWGATSQGAAQDFMNSLMSITYNGTATGSLYVKASNPTAPNTVAYNAVTDIGINNVPKTMRSRLPGVGV
jgi:hypothetical protein